MSDTMDDHRSCHCRPTELERQVAALNAAGYRGATLSEVASSLLDEVRDTQDALTTANSALAWLRDFVEGHERFHTGFAHMRRYIVASQASAASPVPEEQP